MTAKDKRSHVDFTYISFSPDSTELLLTSNDCSSFINHKDKCLTYAFNLNMLDLFTFFFASNCSLSHPYRHDKLTLLYIPTRRMQDDGFIDFAFTHLSFTFHLSKSAYDIEERKKKKSHFFLPFFYVPPLPSYMNILRMMMDKSNFLCHMPLSAKVLWSTEN